MRMVVSPCVSTEDDELLERLLETDETDEETEDEPGNGVEPVTRVGSHGIIKPRRLRRKALRMAALVRHGLSTDAGAGSDIASARIIWVASSPPITINGSNKRVSRISRIVAQNRAY